MFAHGKEAAEFHGSAIICNMPTTSLCTTEELLLASDLLRQGELVAFPTETVYGLGANALDPQAVTKIFAAKGRPSKNPLIVHVLGLNDAAELTNSMPKWAEELAAKFWPGPLTLVLPRSEKVPGIVTGDGPTVGLRSPAHPIARQLLEHCQLPIAAPSANRSGQLSPTTAEHVRKAQIPGLKLILDGGPCPGGLESTVLDLSQDQPCLLRPGMIRQAELEAIIGPIIVGSASTAGETLPSPGMLSRHYAPRTALECAENEQELQFLKNLYETAGLKVGLLRLPQNPTEAAHALFAELHRLDAAGYDRLLTVMPEDVSEWQAIRDRLKRASAEE